MRALGKGCAIPLLATMACHPSLDPLNIPDGDPAAVSICEPQLCTDSVAIRFLGVSGFVIRVDSSTLITGPSFTHPSLWSVFLPFIPLSPDTALIDSLLANEDLSNAHAILVGHSHYDHLLDVPYIARRFAPRAVVYGSPTTANTLSPAGLDSRVHAIPLDSVATAHSSNAWYATPDKRFRFMAIESSHAPTLRWKFFRYTYANAIEPIPRGAMPRTAHGWHLGEEYAYLIDILDRLGKPRFRIYFQDAASKPEFSTLPPLADGKNVDLAIICAGNFENAEDYPLPILTAINPKRVIVGHWEDFFEKPLPPFKGIPTTNTELLAYRLDSLARGRWVVPKPMTRMVYRY